MDTTKKQADFFQQALKALGSIEEASQVNQLSNIEIDILKERLRKIYDQLSSLDVEDEKPGAPVEVTFEIAHHDEINPEPVDEETHEPEPDPEEIENDKLLSGEMDSENKEDVDLEEKEEPDLFSTPDHSKDQEAQSVIEKFSDEVQNESIADQIQKSSKVENLMDAIGINEKFFFINELFDGNLNDYNESIQILDNSASMEEANMTLKGLSQKHNWLGNHEAVEQLRQFIERKFML